MGSETSPNSVPGRPTRRIKRARVPIKHQLILSPHLVHINERHVALGDTRHRDVEAKVGLRPIKRRAIRHNEQLGTAFAKALDDVFPGYAEYRTRVDGIPLFVLEPSDTPGG